jgi:hypothetical protein
MRFRYGTLIYTRKKRKEVYDYWNYTTENNPLTDYTIGIAIEKMVSKMKELPWPIYKIKLGTKKTLPL